MSDYTPPFHSNDRITNLIANIVEEVVKVTILPDRQLAPHLRRANRIRTIHSSLAIEQNTLSLEQVTALVNGKRVLGDPSEIREVQNAIETYGMMLKLNPYSVKDLLEAHKKMMEGLISENGKFRSGGVGVFAGKTLIHMAPPATFVPNQIEELFDWYKESDIHPLVKSSIFHYEFEFIHPFADGNGRMGRFWHSLLLGQWKEIFFWLPIEDLIRARQQEYYSALGAATRNGESSVFVEFILQVILDTLTKTPNKKEEIQMKEDSIPYVTYSMRRLIDVMGNKTLSASEIMELMGLTHKPTFRKNYLNPALEQGLIEMTIPEQPKNRYQKYRRKD